MVDHLTIPERLQDLRKEHKLTLDELAAKTEIASSTLGRYEIDEDVDIPSSSIIALAEFYDESTDYLLGLTEIRKHDKTEIEELGLDSDTIDVLKKNLFNNRLLCELIQHKEFKNFMSDFEIYVDNYSFSAFLALKLYFEEARKTIIESSNATEDDHYMKTLEAVQINEDRYFGELLGDELDRMAKDIKEAHRKDSLTEDESTIISLFQMSPDKLLHEKKQYKRTLALVCRTLEINLKTMPIEDQQKLEEIIRRYSKSYKRNIGRGNNSGKKKH